MNFSQQNPGPVLLFRADGYDPQLLDGLMEKIFAALPAAQRLGPERRVLLKPNLLARHKPEEAVTTHPQMVAAVIRALKRRGVPAQNIVVADSMGGVYNTAAMNALYKTSGLAEVCAAEDVCCYAACKWDTRAVKNGRVASAFTLIEPVLEADFIIDLPKMKTHVMTGCTASVKNLFGCIPGLQKAEWHMRFPDRERFGEMLIDLLETVRPDMAILDGIVGMEGDGPAGGTPRKIGLVAAAEDLPNLDLAVCGLMGLDPMRVPYLAAAHRRGLCAQTFDPACLRGEPDAYAPLDGYRLPGSYLSGSGSTDFAQHLPAVLRPLAGKVEKVIAPHPHIDARRCIGCGKCAEICPRQVIEMKAQGSGRKAKIHPAECIRCFCCHEMCPAKAIEVRQLRLFHL